MSEILTWVESATSEPMNLAVVLIVCAAVVFLAMRLATAVLRIAVIAGIIVLAGGVLLHFGTSAPVPNNLSGAIPVEVVSIDNRGALIRVGEDAFHLAMPNADRIRALVPGEAMMGMLDGHGSPAPALCWSRENCLRLPRRNRVCEMISPDSCP